MGNFVFSTMHVEDVVQPIGRFHRLNAEMLETETLDIPEVVIPNSICFSLDGSTMYYADSMQGCIFAVIISLYRTSAYSQKSMVLVRQTVLVWMQKGFFGMQNRAVVE